MKIRFEKCKKCGKELVRGMDHYTGKGLCKKCYNHIYIITRWKKNKKYRKEQYQRILNWQKRNHDKVKEMAKKCYYKKMERLKKQS